MATVFFPTFRKAAVNNQTAPYATGVGPDNGWKPNGQPSGAPQPYQQVLLNRLAATTKDDGGLIRKQARGANHDTAVITDPYTVFFERFITEPLAAQTLSGTCTIVLGLQGPTGAGVSLTAALILLSSNGTKKADLGSAVGTAVTLTSTNRFRDVVVTMASTVAALGDRIGIELGATIAADSPLDDEAVNFFIGSQLTFGGAAVANGVVDATDAASKSGHFTFSVNVSINPTTWPGGNDVCGGAIVVGPALPVAFGPLDTTKSPGVDPGAGAADPNYQNAAWFTWTSPVTASVIIDTLGSNYHIAIRVFPSCGATLPDLQNDGQNTFFGQSQSAVVLSAVAGTTYFIEFTTRGFTTGSTTATDVARGSGGELRFRLSEIKDAETDDLFLGGKHIVVYRKVGGVWQLVNFNNNVSYSTIPTGMSFDYSRRTIVDLGGGTHDDDRLIHGLFNFTTLTLRDRNALGDFFEVNNIDMTFADEAHVGDAFPDTNAKGGNQRVIPLGRSVGEIIIGTEGDNYDFYGGLSSQDNASFRRVSLEDFGIFSSLVLDKYIVELDVQATDHFDIYDDNDTILYTSAGQRVMRFKMSTQTQLADFIAALPASNSGRPGARGIRILPDQTVIIAQGGQLFHYSADGGTLIKTMVSTNPGRHQSLERIALDSIGFVALVVDIVSSDVLEFDLVSGVHTLTIETNLPAGNLCAIACYRGFEPPPPPPPEPADLGAPPAAGTATSRPIRRQRAAPHINEEQAWIYYSRLQLDFEEGVGLDVASTVVGFDPQIMMDYSDDGGFTWSTELWRSAGKNGDRKVRALWRRLGRSRDRIYRITLSDPVKWAFVDAYLAAQGGTS